MEVMEEGNLMDRIPILLQRDWQYYQEHHSILQESICPGVVGGKLDFPRYASFAAIKIVLWWEDEYYASYKRNSGLLCLETRDGSKRGDDDKELTTGVIVKNSDPEKFVHLVIKSADQLLEHLHTLTQESLDHADLTVLTATIGAAALIKNCLWVYLQSATVTVCPPKGDENGGSLKMSYKQYSEMTEALAERLLDLHCRLLMLYIMQDADCLHWESQKPFFESERGSYIIQMWWLYMRGTSQDLWNSVPPKMAQRVFAGMLNETLTVLTVRYTQTSPSPERSQLLLVDACNLLQCAAEILPYICDSGEAYIGLHITHQIKIIRDIHAKCQEIFYSLLLRGAPLGALFKLFKKGGSTLELFSSREGLPSPWIIFALPKMFPVHQFGHWASSFSELPSSTAISLDLKVLLCAPQANWSFLIKVLLMREAALSTIVLHHLIKNLPSPDNFKPALSQPFFGSNDEIKCGAFLCAGECFDIIKVTALDQDPIGQTNYQVVLALTYVIVSVGKSSDIGASLISALEKSPHSSWADCLDKRQVWDQKRPPWFEAILQFVYPIMDGVVEMLVNAVQTGASMYQAMSLAITCISEMWDCVPDGFYKAVIMLADIIPVTTKPLSESVLIQVLFCALYTKILEAEKIETENSTENVEASESTLLTKTAIYQMLAETICSIDEDNKHTEQINLFLKQAKKSRYNEQLLFTTREDHNEGGHSAVSTVKIDDMEDGLLDASSNQSALEFDVESADYVAELLSSDVITTNIGKQCLKICYSYLSNNKEWLLQQLGVSEIEPSPYQSLPGQSLTEEKPTLLKIMFHIGNNPFDQLLTNSLKIDYTSWLQTPMSISAERAWLQIAKRWEFQENAKVSMHETAMIALITENIKK